MMSASTKILGQGDGAYAFALTEPQSGSDATNMYSRAVINGGDTWTISKAKA